MNNQLELSETYIRRLHCLALGLKTINEAEKTLGRKIDNIDGDKLIKFIEAKEPDIRIKIRGSGAIEQKPEKKQLSSIRRGVKPREINLPNDRFTVKSSGITHSIIARLLRDEQIVICGEVKARGRALKIYKKA